MGGVIAFVVTLAMMPRSEPLLQKEWKPSFCATFLSKDGVPLAVCNDVFYPVYDVGDGYVGLLSGCLKIPGQVIRDCRRARL